jgi:hypothetical protein
MGMSKRLLDVLTNFQIAKGNLAIALLAHAVDKHPMTIERWLKTRRIPKTDYAFKLAVAAGCSQEEALALVRDELLQVKTPA